MQKRHWTAQSSNAKFHCYKPIQVAEILNRHRLNDDFTTFVTMRSTRTNLDVGEMMSQV